MLARACWYWSMPLLNMAEAPLALSRAARLGRGAMTLGAMPCPASQGEEEEEDRQKKRKTEDVLGERQKKKKTKTKGTYVREHHINEQRQNILVCNNINLIISSVASKQHSDTDTTQAGAWCLLELTANKHSDWTVILRYSEIIINWTV